METAQLYQGLTFLAYATGVIVILVGIMLIKLLFDLSRLTNNNTSLYLIYLIHHIVSHYLMKLKYPKIVYMFNFII